MVVVRLSGPSVPGGVVVTGGGSGIGRAAAVACARAGAAVAVFDVDRGAAEAAVSEIEQTGAPPAFAFGCDVRDEADVVDAIAAAADAIGPLRGLVASAGIDRGGMAHELDTEVWLDVLLTNLTGTFFTCKHMLRHMLAEQQRGSIVCVSSPFAQMTAPGGTSAYCASKGGISAFVRSLALDYASHGIRVNAIVPGATDTPLMWASFSAREIPAARDRIGKQLAMGRLADPVEIAAGIVWLLSEQSSYVTGSHLVVDGGLMATANIEA